MSVSLTVYVFPKPPIEAQKRKTAIFRLKLHFSRRKSATNVIYVKAVSDKVVRHSFAHTV